ncbi:MAG: ChrR family anti-sigma-E factor [Mangrovicoccus sp.]
MMPRVTHNLPDDVLLAYSAGQLSLAFDLVVASHVSLSDDSRARLEAFDAVGGMILDEVEPIALGDDSFAATMALIQGAAPEDCATTPPRPKGVFPDPLRQMVGGDLDSVAWRPIGMGARQAILHSDKGGSVRLLYIPTGVAMPTHSHHGNEMTLVLQGAYRDEFDEFHRGDVELADQDLDHTPVAFGDEDCICLAATDDRLKFSSLLPRLAQPFLRI